MALVATKLAGSSGTTASLGSGTFTAPTAGNILIVVGSQGNGGARITGVSDNTGDDSATGDWTLLGTANSAATEAAWWWKAANGSETSVTMDMNASSGADMMVFELSGWADAPAYQDHDNNDAHIDTAITTSPIGMGTVTNTAAVSAIVFAWIGSDGLGLITDSRSVSDGNAYTECGDQGTQQYAYYREVSTSGPFSPQYAYSDTGDQVYAGSIVFADVSGGGSVESGAGSSAGSATASAVGASTAASTGTSAGAAAAAGAGASIAASAGSSAGAGTASATGASTAAAVGTAAGTSTATGVADGGSVESGAGTAAGESTATGVGASTAAAAGTSAGQGSATAVGADAAATAVPVSCVASLSRRSITVTMTRRTASVSFSKRSAVCALEVA